MLSIKGNYYETYTPFTYMGSMCSNLVTVCLQQRAAPCAGPARPYTGANSVA